MVETPKNIDSIKKKLCNFAVAPLAGAWIEIVRCPCHTLTPMVAPLAGAWIEIFSFFRISHRLLVAPLAGAWIEIYMVVSPEQVKNGRSPCGSVD